MGSVRARPETGRLYLEFRLNGKRYREQTQLNDTPANRKKVCALLKRVEDAIEGGRFVYGEFFPGSRHAGQTEPITPVQPASVDARSTAPLFESFVMLFREEQRVSWRLATLESFDWIVESKLVPWFGDKRVNEITRADVLEFRTALIDGDPLTKQKPLSPKSANSVVGTLKSIMDEAAIQHSFASPTDRVRRLKVPRRDIQPFSLEEVNLILDTVRPDYHGYLTVRFFTGLRSGEINGLKWKHVDFEKGELLIRETFSKGRTEYTKTDGSQREVQMNYLVREALQSHLKPGNAPDDYVFGNAEGHPIDVNNFTNRVWHPLLRLLGLQKRRPYECRHTAATLWLAAGESPEWIARQLGHTTTEMLFRVYSRYVPNLAKNDGSATERLLAKRIGELK